MAKKLASFEAWLDKFVVEQVTLSLFLSLRLSLSLNTCTSFSFALSRALTQGLDALALSPELEAAPSASDGARRDLLGDVAVTQSALLSTTSTLRGAMGLEQKARYISAMSRLNPPRLAGLRDISAASLLYLGDISALCRRRTPRSPRSSLSCATVARNTSATTATQATASTGTFHPAGAPWGRAAVSR